MASMYEAPAGPGALPTFGADVQQSTRVREFTGIAGDEAAKVFGNLSQQLGQWEDHAAQDQGVQQGKVAGLDPNYRPDQDASIMGIARRNAADATYTNTLEASARTSLGNAYDQYQKLPADQRTPDRLQKMIGDIQSDFDQNHVFPQIKGQFDNSFGAIAQSYLRNAQADLDARNQDAAKASFLVNQNSARDSAMRLASLPATDDATLATLVKQHDATVDNQVNQGLISREQSVKVKDEFKQEVLGQRILTLFNNTPDEQKAAFAENFQRQFLQPGDAGAARQYLSTLSAHPGRPGDTSELHPEFATRLAAAVKEARAAGLPVTITSGFRSGDTTGSAYDAEGFSLHDKGAAADVGGIGAAGSPQAQQWAAIASKHGLFNPYGVDNSAEFNHWQLVPYKLEQRPDVQAAIKAANGDMPKIWDAISPTLGGASRTVGGLSFETASKTANAMTSSLRAVDSQAQHAQKQALGDIGGDLKQIEAGYDVPESEWAAKRSEYGGAADPVVAHEFAVADRIRTMYAGFKGLPPAQVDGAVSAMQAQLAKSGADPDQARIVEAASKYAKTLREQFDRNPLARSAADGVIPGVVPLDFSSPEATERTLQARVAAADQTAQHYGLSRAPLVTPDDRETVKNIAAAGGEPMVQAAAGIAHALGPRAGDFLSQVGGEAPQFAQMGRLAAIGGDPGLMRDAAWAISQDHQQGAKVQRPAPESVQQAIATTYGKALQAIPDFAQGAKNLAGSALAAQIMREGLDPKQLDQTLVNQTLQKAVGATYVGGTQYGGIASTGFWHGQQALAPANVRADQFGALLKSITDADIARLPAPPTAPDGSVMKASQLQGMQLTSLGPGVYYLSKGDPQGEDPQWATVAGGQRGGRARFLLDLNAMESDLRPRLPGAYK